MAPSKTFSLKFTSDGLQEVLSSSEKVRKSYIDWVTEAEDSIKKANEMAQQYAGNQDKIAESEQIREKAARQANRAIAQSYQELGFKSSKSIEDSKKRAISAYEALKKSGVASSEDLKRAAVALERKLKSLDNQLDRVDDSARDAGGGFTIMKGAIAGIAANLATSAFSGILSGLSNIVTRSISTRAELSKLRDQLELLEGSEIAGDTAFAKISEFAKTTPFEINEVTQAYVKLGNRGIKPTNDQLIALGDLALSQGKSLDQLVEAVLDAQTGENERLKEFGIRGEKSGDTVAFSFKGLRKEVDLTSDAVLEALVGFGKVDGVAGSIDKAANRLDGVGSNISDTFTQIFDSIGGALEPLLVAGGKALVEFLDPLTDPAIFAPLVDALQYFMQTLGGLTGEAQSLQEFLAGGIRSAIEFIAGLIYEISNLIRDSPTLIGGILEVLKAAATVLGGIVAAIAFVSLTWAKLNIAVGNFISFVTKNVLGAIAEIPAFLGRAVGGMQALWGAFIQEIIQVLLGVKVAWLTVQKAAIEGWDFIKGKTLGAIDAAKGWVAQLGEGNIVLNAAKAPLDAIKAAVGALLQPAKDVLGKFLEWLKQNEFVQEQLGNVQKAVEFILTPFRAVLEVAKGIWETIGGWLKPLDAALAPLREFKKLMDGILGGSQKVGTDAGKKLGDAFGEGGPLLPAPEGAFHPSKFPVTSPFGMRNGRLHAGTDYGTPQGTPLGNIWGSGVVTIADGNVGGYGGLIELTLKNGDVYRFGHMSKINVRQGQVVPAGALLGLTGGMPGTPGAGRSTGPHLHLEYYPSTTSGAVPYTGGRGGPANNIRSFGRGGATKKKSRKKPLKLKEMISSIDSLLVSTVGDFTQEEDMVNKINSRFDRVIEKIDKAEEKIKETIALKREEKESYDAEKKALAELDEIRKKAIASRDEEIKQSKELLKVRNQAEKVLSRIQNENELSGLEQKFLTRQAELAERKGAITPFQLEQAQIQSQIVGAQADFSEKLASLELQKIDATNDEQRQHLDQLIAKYRELNKLTLDELTFELEELTEAQRQADLEAKRIFPKTQELAQIGFEGFKGFLSGLGDVLTGTKKIGDLILDTVRNLISRLASLFADRAFSMLENLLFPQQRNRGGGGGGITGLIGGLVGSFFGGGGRSAGGLGGLLGNAGSRGLALNRGGLVMGPGTSTSDSISARLSNGEYVINAAAVRSVGIGALDQINRMGSGSNSISRSNTVNFNINTPSAGDFGRTSRQLHSQAVATLQKFR